MDNKEFSMKNLVKVLGLIVIAAVIGFTMAGCQEEEEGPDTTAPVLSAGTVNRTSDTAAKIGFKTDEAGTAYYRVVEKDATAPTNTTVKTGTSLGAVSGTVSGKDVTLTAGAKDIYVVVEDAAGNISAPLKIAAAAYDPNSGGGEVSGVVFIEADEIDFTKDDGERADFPTSSITTAGQMPKYLLLSVGDNSGWGIGGINVAFNSSDGWKETDITTEDWTDLDNEAGVFIIDLSQCTGYSTVGLSGGWVQVSMWIGGDAGKTGKSHITGAAFVFGDTEGATTIAALCIAGNKVDGTTILWYVGADNIEELFE